MNSLRNKLHYNNYPEIITLAPRNLDQMTENNIQKLTIVCFPYVKGLTKKIQKIYSPYDMGTIFRSGSTLQKYLFWVKPPKEYMTKNCIYSIPCSWGKVFKAQTCCPLKIRPEEHWKAVVWGEIKKSGMADHIWKEKGNHLPLWDEVKIIDKEEY